MPEEKIGSMPSDGQIGRTAELFKVFGDPTRLRILYSLLEREMRVTELAEKVGMSPSAVSHQLKTLKQACLVGARREGKTVLCALADDHVRTMLGQAMEHICE